MSSYELNLSGTESSFTVLPHRHVQDVPQKSDTLWVSESCIYKLVMAYKVSNTCLNSVLSALPQAGGVFRLFHREIECYLVADGSFADVDADGITEDGQCIYTNLVPRTNPN